AFHGTITGSLLGDAVSVDVRGVDEVAVAAIVLLALVAVADVLYLGMRERAREFAALRATGWTWASLARLVNFERPGIGLLGALGGAAIAGVAAAVSAATAPGGLVPLTLAVAGTGVLAAGLAALAPALLGRRAPISTLLAEE